MVTGNELINLYWDDKMANLEAIKIPAYVVASYTTLFIPRAPLTDSRRSARRKNG